MESRDIDTLAALQRTEVVTCRGADEPSQIGSPPACADVGVPEGTELTVGWGASCEGYQSPSPGALLVNWLPRQDGLYAVVSSRDGARLVFHGSLMHGAFALELWVVDGLIDLVNFGCAQNPEQRVQGETIVYGPWPEPLTSDAGAVGALMTTYFEAVAARDVEALAGLIDNGTQARGCELVSRDRQEIAEHFLGLNPSFVGVYERLPNVWWVVYDLDTGIGRFEISGPLPRIRGFFYPCDRTVEELTTDGLGQPLERIELPSE